MITRREVAARLGKSVATVRRIEGVLLFPVRDRRGIYRFDPDDVERLAERLAEGEVSLWQEFRHGRDRSGFEHWICRERQSPGSAVRHSAENPDLMRENEDLRECLRAVGAFVLDAARRHNFAGSIAMSRSRLERTHDAIGGGLVEHYDEPAP